jgi:hypothetical protein
VELADKSLGIRDDNAGDPGECLECRIEPTRADVEPADPGGDAGS